MAYIRAAMGFNPRSREGATPGKPTVKLERIVSIRAPVKERHQISDLGNYWLEFQSALP